MFVKMASDVASNHDPHFAGGDAPPAPVEPEGGAENPAVDDAVKLETGAQTEIGNENPTVDTGVEVATEISKDVAVVETVVKSEGGDDKLTFEDGAMVEMVADPGSSGGGGGGGENLTVDGATTAEAAYGSTENPPVHPTTMETLAKPQAGNENSAAVEVTMVAGKVSGADNPTLDNTETVAEGGDDENNNPILDDAHMHMVETAAEAMEEDQVVVEISEADIWPNEDGGEDDGLLDSSIFYPDFPPLPEFPCMSSSSSSSPSTPAAPSSAGSSSPVVSWPMMRPDPGEGLRTTLSSTASMEMPHPPRPEDQHNQLGIDVMGNLGYIDLMDPNEIWDPSSLFQTDNPHDELLDSPPPATVPVHTPMETSSYQDENENENDGFASFIHSNAELAVIFFEWLKQNRDYISAEDMRSIKLRRSTIESATKRLGTNNEGKKQLLKLILQWVEQYRLHKRRAPVQNPNPNPNYAGYPNTTCYSSGQAYVHPIPGYNNIDPYGNPIHLVPVTHHHQVVNGFSTEYQVMDPTHPWAMPPPPVMPMTAHPTHYGPTHYPENVNSNHQPAVYGSNPYRRVYDSSAMKLGSLATKEARKKRMARQRRMYANHHHHRHAGGGSSQLHSHSADAAHGEGDDGGEYWMTGGGSSDPVDGGQAGKLAGLDRRQQQGLKVEKNLKFLLQKVLKQSDVGNLGRIVLPKKEAESHLPELETRDGITIAMEDIGTSRVWNMRYRFWPNNKSRMYLLENTGDFVRLNGLQEGDFIVIYSDTKCGKYMIRGVKVREPGTKPERKKPVNKNIRNLSLAGRKNPPLAPLKLAIK
ncbi:B3 domain-containing transcription factor ABI3 [Striga hermonthica]|uniref:B3 domain-containing transcription factor ABI3 n=1 Tax=Striga hermonthica TaxID=68872 RepID=A0A9N7N412_STRHE|nr:B3 domain-containing transcription factor ABI3 [Striga hermonthica]